MAIRKFLESLSENELSELKEEASILQSQPTVYFNTLKKSKFSNYFSNIQTLLNTKFPRQVLYHVFHPDIPTCSCGSPVNWNVRAYRTFCCKECSVKSDQTKQKAKETLIRNYGVDHPSKSLEIKQKKEDVFLKKYGVKNPFQADDIKKKITDINIERYGASNPFQSDIIKQQIIDTNIEKYGAAHHMQKPEIRQKVVNTNLERYGVETSLQNAEVREKARQTMIEKYGVEHASQSVEIQEKIKQTLMDKYGVINISQLVDHNEKCIVTCQERYGVDYHLQRPDIKDTIKQSNIEKYGVPYASQSNTVKEKSKQTSIKKYGIDHYKKMHYSEEALEFLTNEELFRELVSKNTMKSLAIHYGISTYPIYAIMKELGLQPYISHNRSEFEKEIVQFIETIHIGTIEICSRKLITPKELDIYLPDYNIAIECNGAYWHSELNGRDETYHLHKTSACRELDINLLHVWDYIWNTKPDIIKSMIRHKLGMSTKIFARKCSLREIGSHAASAFFETNHIQGKCPASVYIGLFHDGYLVSCMSFGKSRYDKSVQWELIRFSNKLDYTVVGGASKMLAYFVNRFQPDSIMSYADKSRGNGNVYGQLGFKKARTTPPSYLYTKDYLQFFSRQKFQKHKLVGLLETYDESLTEWENMMLNNYDRIWDCGTDVWLWNR